MHRSRRPAETYTGHDAVGSESSGARYVRRRTGAFACCAAASVGTIEAAESVCECLVDFDSPVGRVESGTADSELFRDSRPSGSEPDEGRILAVRACFALFTSLLGPRSRVAQARRNCSRDVNSVSMTDISLST